MTAGRFDDPRIIAWVNEVVARHAEAFTRSEFLKAVRALSSRYVEQRAALSSRSALDSAGKRAAFAGFYAPIHLLTAFAIFRACDVAASPPAALIDVGCGTGVAGAAWALAADAAPRLSGIDLNVWALEEAHWNWRALGLTGRTRRGDLVDALAAAARPRTTEFPAIVCGWSLNELAPGRRDTALEHLLGVAGRGARVCVLEPIATSAVPWWPAFEARAVAAGARADTWRFDDPLPDPLASLDRDAGFAREALTARSIYFSG